MKNFKGIMFAFIMIFAFSVGYASDTPANPKSNDFHVGCFYEQSDVVCNSIVKPVLFSYADTVGEVGDSYSSVHDVIYDGNNSVSWSGTTNYTPISISKFSLNDSVNHEAQISKRARDGLIQSWHNDIK